jgi:hypothetical protein
MSYRRTIAAARKDKKQGRVGLTEEQKQEIREAFDLVSDFTGRGRPAPRAPARRPHPPGCRRPQFDTDGSGTIDAKVRRRGPFLSASSSRVQRAAAPPAPGLLPSCAA